MTTESRAAGDRPDGERQHAFPVLRLRLNGAATWLAERSRSRWLSLGLVAAIFAVDLVLMSRSHSFLVRGALDEPAHLATGFILLGTITRWRRRLPSAPFTWGLLVMSVAIDIDHLPAEFASTGILYGNLPRPYTHALWLLALLILIALAAHLRARSPGSRRDRQTDGGLEPAAQGHPRAAFTALLFAGAAWGLASHFFRDLGTAPIALLWPLSSAALQMPYRWYLGPLILLAILPLQLPRRLR